jgi:hypothetical protein
MIGIAQYENRIRYAIARVHRRPRGFPTFRRWHETDSLGPSLHACATRTSLPKKGGCEPEPARAEAKGQPFSFPRPCRLEGEFRFSRLACEFGIGQPFSHDLTYRQIEPRGIVHFPIIVAASLLVDIPKQVERLDTHVGAVQAALQKRPEVLQSIGMDLAFNIRLRMVDDLVRKVLFQTPIGEQFVGVDVRSFADVFFNDWLKSFLFAVLDYGRSHFAAALEHSHYDGLLERAILVPLAGVHIAGFSTDEGFIHFDVTGEFAAVLALLGQTDAVKQEPSGFLSGTQRASDLATTDAVLAVLKHPDCREPLIKADRRVFHDGADLHGELPLGMPDAALPAELLFQKAHSNTPADRANNPVLPFGTASDKVVQAVLGIREVDDCFLEGLWFVGAFHTSIVPQNRVLGKYIFTAVTDMFAIHFPGCKSFKE